MITKENLEKIERAARAAVREFGLNPDDHTELVELIAEGFEPLFETENTTKGNTTNA